jgi:hypothetical protein
LHCCSTKVERTHAGALDRARATRERLVCPSPYIDIRDVRGSVHIASDGSGDIFIHDVQQDVLIDDDSSGSIRVANVGGNFIVRKDGSRRIHHTGVRGKVSLPRGK